MAGFATGTINSVLDCYFGGVGITAPTAIYGQLHTGDPGSAGTANQATETDRVALTFGTLASAGAKANTSAASWIDVAATETYTHISVWTASSGGTFIASGTITAAQVAAGGTFTLAVGDLVASAPTA